MSKTKSKKGWHPVMFIIPRVSRDENTFAMVTADVADPVFDTETGFLRAMHVTLSAWFKTSEGQAAWKRSSKDFNVGDLSENTQDRGLCQILLTMGIRGLEVETFVDTNATGDWTYDTVLGEAE